MDERRSVYFFRILIVNIRDGQRIEQFPVAADPHYNLIFLDPHEEIRIFGVPRAVLDVQEEFLYAQRDEIRDSVVISPFRQEFACRLAVHDNIPCFPRGNILAGVLHLKKCRGKEHQVVQKAPRAAILFQGIEKYAEHGEGTPNGDGKPDADAAEQGAEHKGGQ